MKFSSITSPHINDCLAITCTLTADTKLTAIPQLDGANQESSEEEESEDSEDDDEAVNQVARGESKLNCTLY